MALLKSLIQRLLDSRTTPEEAGHSAMPSPTEVSLTPSVTSQEVWGDVCTGIASSDGYIRMDFGATSPEAIGSARSFGAVAFSTPQKTGDIVSVICPVAKGRAYAMSVRNANNITCAFVKLIGSIWGGQALKNALLQGGGLCLNSLSSSLRRSSLSVKRNGSDIRLFRITVLALTLRSNRTLHLQTDGLAFVRPLLNLIVLLTQRAELLHGFLVMRSQLLRQQQHCLFLRVKHLPSTSQAEYQKFGSHQLTVPQLNFALGGASC